MKTFAHIRSHHVTSIFAPLGFSKYFHSQSGGALPEPKLSILFLPPPILPKLILSQTLLPDPLPTPRGLSPTARLQLREVVDVPGICGTRSYLAKRLSW